MNFVAIAVFKVFWRLTYVKLEERVTKVEKAAAEEKEKNEAFRHKHEYSVKSLADLIEMKFHDLDKTLNRFESQVQTQVKLAISESKHEKA